MERLREAWQRFLGLFRSRGFEAEMREEMRFHIEMETHRNVEAGMTEKAARQAALKRFGHMDGIKENARGERSFPVVANTIRDLKIACRQLRRSPGFSIVVVVTIALGVGMNTSMFSVLNGLLLRPLDFAEPEQLFRLDRNTVERQFADHSAENFMDIKEACADFADLAGVIGWGSNVDSPDAPAEIVSVARVTANYFDLLGIKPIRGRMFQPDEELEGNDRVIAISDRFWKRRFGGRENVVGSMVSLDKREVEIVAIIPTITDVNRITGGKRFPEPIPVFKPVSFSEYELNGRASGTVEAIGRLRPGVDFGQAQQRFDIIASDLAGKFPTYNSGVSLGMRPLQTTALSDTNRSITFVLLGLSGFVLLIACGNLANLLLARAMTRGRDYAMYAALGASPRQLMRPVIAECGLLALLGAGAAVFVANQTSRWLASRFGDEHIPVDFSIDGRVLAFTCIISLVTTAMFSLVPAWWTSRTSPNDSLKADGRTMSGSGPQRIFRNLLVIGQFALALVLLVGAGVFIRGIERLRHDDLGWNPSPVITAMVNLQDERYGWGEPRVNFHNMLRERLMSIPGVENAAVSNEVPVIHSPTTYEYSIWNGDPQGGGEDVHVAYSSVVSASYFETLGTQLISGRPFGGGDHTRSRWVAIINQTMAEQLFPEGNAVGQGIGYLSSGRMAWMEIVGIVEDTRPIEATPSEIKFQVYQPYSQRTWEYVLLSVRATSPEVATSLIEPIRKVADSLDASIAFRRITPMTTLVKQHTSVWETINQLLVLFAALGTSLAALGVYSVVSRTTSLRIHEFGIRRALGASDRKILVLVLFGNLRMAVLGTFVGLLGIGALYRYLATELPMFSIGISQIVSFSVAFLVLVAVAACLLPARRAIEYDPADTLRADQ